MQIDESQLVRGEIADYYLHPGGILYSFSKHPRRTVQNIEANSKLVQQLTGRRKVPLLLFVCKSSVPDRETRQLSRKLLSQNYSALAMVGQPGLSTLILRILFRLQKPPIPIRAFTDAEKAKEWLSRFLSSDATR